MKRSEALEIINGILCEYYEAATDGKLCDDEAQDIMGNLDWSDDILFRLERAGMLPPKPKTNLNGFPNNQVGNVWEPEGEEIPPCESCAKNGQPNCGNSHCPTRNKD